MDGILEVQLYMREVKETSFRTYKLHADNGITTLDTVATLQPETSMLHLTLLLVDFPVFLFPGRIPSR